MRRLVIAQHNLPTRCPVTATFIAWLLLDRFQPPLWVWVVALVLIGLWWVAAVSSVFVEKAIDVFAPARLLRGLEAELRDVGELAVHDAVGPSAPAASVAPEPQAGS